MTTIEGSAYDGRSSERLSATLSLSGQHFQLSVPQRQLNIRTPLDEVQISPRIGNTPRKLLFPDGYSFHCDDNDAIDTLLKNHLPNSSQAFIHRLESGYRYVLGALLITVLCSWLFVTQGLPALAHWAAFQLPPNLLQTTGDQTLTLLDKYGLQATQLSEARQQELTTLFAENSASLPEDLAITVVFRDGDQVGANAFALPNGVVLFTDQLVNAACSDQELLAIYGHEAGHLIHHHSLRHAIQGSIMAIALTLLVGDASAMGELLAGVPTLLVELRFSRNFEHEADDFARQFMLQQNIALHHFSSILARISSSDEIEPETKSADDAPSFFSTHPTTPQRIAKFGEPQQCEAQ